MVCLRHLYSEIQLIDSMSKLDDPFNVRLRFSGKIYGRITCIFDVNKNSSFPLFASVIDHNNQ